MCLNPGDILAGRYRIIAKLGHGGFAITYTAQDIQNPGNPPCVIKEIPFPESHDRVLEKARNRFQREVSALRTLRNDSRIPQLFDHFEENGNFYLVQEFIQGTPLSQELPPGKRWTEKDVITLLREILEILNSVHKANIIHRDITPSNLIRRKNSQIVLIDFGAVKEISTFTSNSTGEILTSQAIGTSGYMPAEQYNPRSSPQPYNDIYPVGIIAIQALTGRHPRNLPHDPETGEILWNFSTSDRVSDGLTNILNQMVRFNFQQRYQSASEVLQALDLIELPPPIESPQPKPRKGGSRLLWLLFGFAGLGAALAIAYFIPPLLQPPIPLDRVDRVSAGEELIIKTASLWSKQRAIQEFADRNYLEALKLFKQSWGQEKRKDPETLIYMNNALLMATKAEYYTIAIVVPTRRNPDGSIVNANLAEELLRGVAQAQTEVNLSLLTTNDSNKDFPDREFLELKQIKKGKGLRVLIADDLNIESEAVKRANSLVAQPDILAVLGHYTSEMTLATIDIYNTNKLVAISPGSTTEELTRKPRKFFFRTAPTTSVEAESLVNYLLKVGQKEVVGFYNPNSPFTASLWEEFIRILEAKGGNAIRINEFYDLSKNDFNAGKAIKAVDQTGKNAMVLIPDGQVTNSLQNAIEMIKANQDRHWIVGPWTLYDRKVLEAAKELKSIEKIAISTPWHPLTSFDKKFSDNAQKLWGGPVNSRSALTYDAARTLIKSLEMQPQPTREGMQKSLADPNFKAEGATGIIEFELNNGNRKNPAKVLVHIVPCSRKEFGLTFVPIEFPAAAAAGLKCE
jgi:ABC-type branched-subunit amino acid transport system substrate-binding protein/serine/threonine protein kinase